MPLHVRALAEHAAQLRNVLIRGHCRFLLARRAVRARRVDGLQDAELLRPIIEVHHVQRIQQVRLQVSLHGVNLVDGVRQRRCRCDNHAAPAVVRLQIAELLEHVVRFCRFGFAQTDDAIQL